MNAKVLELARSMDLNNSQTVDRLLAQEVRRLYWERWNERNKDAIAACNEWLASYGLPLAKYRTWGKALGTGKSER
ncbi:MAG: type II toxin-antitoxin system CcdA family antitoxin [Rhodoferax sp.]|nr:type II toxin-antitoxin system CcdA family antitoxin [Rhodoferax sp.]